MSATNSIVAEHYQTAIAAATASALAASNAASQAATAAAHYAHALACHGDASAGMDRYAKSSMEECADNASVAALEAAQAMENAQRAAEIAVEAAALAEAECTATRCAESVTSDEQWADAAEYLRMNRHDSFQGYAQYSFDDFDYGATEYCRSESETEWSDLDDSLKIAAYEQFTAVDFEQTRNCESASDSSVAQSEVESEWAALTNSMEIADAVAHAENIRAQLEPMIQAKNESHTPLPLPIVTLHPDKSIGDWTGGLLIKQDKDRSVQSAFGQVTEILPFKTLIMVEETPEYPLSKFLQIPYESLRDMAEFEYSKPVQPGEFAMGLLKVDGPGDKLMYGMGRAVGVKHDANLYLVSNGFEDMGIDVCHGIEV